MLKTMILQGLLGTMLVGAAAFGWSAATGTGNDSSSITAGIRSAVETIASGDERHHRD